MKQLKHSGTTTASLLIVSVFLLLSPSLFAATGEELVEKGREQFGNADYQSALLTFRDIVLNSSMDGHHGEAYFWIARSYMAMEKLDKAEQNLEFFLSEYEGHSRYPEALYQKGRLLHLQEEYQKSIRQLYRYIEEFPSHPYKANAYFWVGESFYALGHYDKAEAIFSLVVRDFPKSYKVEAGKYRISLIDLKRREEELLKLLKMSHEEYLKALEEFDRKEKSYEQAIAGYQRKLAAATADNDNELIAALNEDLEQKNSRIRSLEEEKARLEEQVAALSQQIEGEGGTVPSISSTGSKTRRLLELKSRALSLKEKYIEALSEQGEGM